MAKFKNSNIELKTNQKILLGDSQDVSISYDGSAMMLDTTAIIVTGTVAANSFAGDGSQLTNVPPTDPYGNNTEVQYNDNGVFGSSQHFVFTGTAIRVGTSGIYMSAFGDIGRANNDIFVIAGSEGNPTGRSYLHLMNSGGALLRGAEGSTFGVNGSGQDVTLQAGDGAGTGDGGNIVLTPGDGTASGYVKIVVGGVQVGMIGETLQRIGKASSAGRVDVGDTEISATVGSTEVLSLLETEQILGEIDDSRIHVRPQQNQLDIYGGSNIAINAGFASTNIYYSGTKVFTTVSTGIDVQPTSGTDAYVNLRQSNGTLRGAFQCSSDETYLRVGSSNDIAIRMKDSEYVRLYYNGTSVFSTTSDGIRLNLGVININEFSSDGTLIGDSDTALPTEKAVKTYVDTQIIAIDQISQDDSYIRVVDDGTAAGYIEIVADGVQVSYWDAESSTIRIGKESGAGRIAISDTTVYTSIGTTDVLTISENLQRLGVSANTYAQVNQPSDYFNVVAAGSQVFIAAANLQRLGAVSATNVTTTVATNTIAIEANNVEVASLTETLQTLGVSGDSRIEISQAADSVDIYCGSTNILAANLNGVTVTGDLQITGDLILDSTSALTASEVQYDNITPSTYNTVQDGMDTLGSPGLISGGVITADGTAAVNVTAGTGMLRTTNDEFADIEFIDFAESLSLAITEDETKNIVVYYNGGSPVIQAVDIGAGNVFEYFILGQVGRAGDELFISNIRQRISNFAIRSLARLNGTRAVERDGNTGLIIGESGDGDRYVTMTSGDVWSLIDLDSISSFNSGTGDSFTTIYRDSPSGYVETPGQTQWDMEKYDDGSGTLKDLSKNKFGVRWFWYIPSSADMSMVYGTGNWKSLAEAEAEPVPTEVPSIISEYGVLIGKIICQKDEDIAAEVSSAFDEVYNFAATTNHGNLSNLASPYDDHTQYSHIDGRRDFTGTVGGLPPISSSDFVTLDYMVRLGTPEQRLFYNVDQTGHLDIHVEHIRDLQFADFDDDIPTPAWQEGRVFWDKVNHTFGVYNDIPEITLQVGQESHLRVRNISGQTIPDGSPIYITGADQGLPTIDLAKADDISTLSSVSIATHSIENNTNGYTTLTGAVNDVDTSQFNAGDPLYVSDSTAGIITNQRPKSPNIAHRVGVATQIGSMGRLVSDSHPSTDQMQVLTYTLPLKGVVDAILPLTGTFREIDSGETGDVGASFGVSNQHLYIYVNSLTGSGDVSIVGAQLSENSSVQDSTGEEVITIDQAGTYYQTSFKWWEVDSITIPPGISAINYDYGVIGYPDMGNRNFSIIGYRCDAYADKDGADFSLLIDRVKDDGDKKMSVVPLENMGVQDEGVGIVDNLRTGEYDRSFLPNTSNFWEANSVLTLKQLDFNTYFTNNENDILSKEKNEGMFIRIEGEPGGGITDVDFIILYLYYELLP